MTDTKNFYITTTLPYVNSDPHIGFAMEIIQADIVARYKRLSGYNVFFNTGTDEHGVKIFEKAMSSQIPTQQYVDQYAERFKELKERLNLSYTNFIRTTDPHHIKAAQEFWKRCFENGDIYKGEYEIKYCIGCELEKHDSELVDGKCPIHPNLELQIRKEENYLFRQSKYQQQLLDFYEANPKFVIPEGRFNEIKSFVKAELRDFSISRLKEKMPWGIPVPGDDDHVMYVWFDALVNYISTLGWPNDGAVGDEGEEGDAGAGGNIGSRNFAKFWPGVQVAGKDNLRQQSAMWQAMLMSAGISPSKQIFIHGFVNSGGQKMSKSLGNVINPLEITGEYGIDALRYFIAREFSPYEDSDFTIERFKEAYNANLANGIGNLTSRILKMATSYEVDFDSVLATVGDNKTKSEIFDSLADDIDEFNFSSASNKIWQKIAELDTSIQEKEPFKKIKVDKEGAIKDVENMLIELYKIAYALGPFLPETSEKIIKLIESNTFPETPLFVRKD